ncbi:MAG: hypothetical protein AAF498_15415 [Pseudomonadota bacterium]
MTANRDRGNATELLIRGLGPNLSNTLLNGREMVLSVQNEPIASICWCALPYPVRSWRHSKRAAFLMVLKRDLRLM